MKTTWRKIQCRAEVVYSPEYSMTAYDNGFWRAVYSRDGQAPLGLEGTAKKRTLAQAKKAAIKALKILKERK